VIKSQHATIRLPELDFEIPPLTQAGSLTTVEGVLMQAASGLESMQPQRREVDAPTAGKIQSVIDELRNLAAGARPFVLTLDDPSGQSLIETTSAGSQDFALTARSYTRSAEQDADLGVALAGTAGEEGSSRHHAGEEGRRRHHAEATSEDAPNTQGTSQDAPSAPAPTDGHLSTLGGGGSRWVPNKAVSFGAREGAAEALDVLYAPACSSEVEVFRLACPSCRAEGEEERMYPTRIPHFGQVIIMAFTCGQCGYRSNEVCAHIISVTHTHYICYTHTYVSVTHTHSLSLSRALSLSLSPSLPLPPPLSLSLSQVKPAASSAEEGAATHLELDVRTLEDWNRLVLKSHTAEIVVPEIDLYLAPGTLGSTLTTVEGLLAQVLVCVCVCVCVCTYIVCIYTYIGTWAVTKHRGIF
jgi:C4-type Zn-finger protein